MSKQTHLWRRLGAALFMFGVLAGSAGVAKAAAPSPAQDVLTLGEAAELLRIGADELEQLASRDEVPGRRIGSSWRFNRDALMAWLNGDWHRIAAIEPTGATGARSPAVAGLALTPRELERTTGTGTLVAQASPHQNQTGSPPSSTGEMPIGEAPQEATAEDVFLRGTKVLLAAGEVAADVGQFYARADTPGLAVIGDGVGLANVKQSTFITLLQARVGIFNETELFAGTTFRHQTADVSVGGTKVAGNTRTEFGDVRLGVRHTLLAEGPGRPNVIATLEGHIPTGHTSYGIGGGFAVVKSFDPVVLFAASNYRHTFSRDFLDVTRLEPENRFDLTLGYALALNDTLTISTSVSGVFADATSFDNATLLQQEGFSLQLGLTSYLAPGLYIEPSVSFGLSGPGNAVAFGVTLPYSF